MCAAPRWRSKAAALGEGFLLQCQYYQAGCRRDEVVRERDLLIFETDAGRDPSRRADQYYVQPNGMELATRAKDQCPDERHGRLSGGRCFQR